ncbi:LysM peptidoglycan-binding domain-containing protein [Lacrimispora sp. 38-1]|uniref:LysM peptidoglycan-binding domain-containing protein n=1 Tax=Lacrimispora sp. 38-1 TaxID=3125778 RepID=UPI003CF58337
MGELYNPFPKLPKNIRQIGERDEIVKLYVEDYVNTYLKRLYPVSGQRLRVGLLLGSMELNDGTPYIFIDGALEMEDVTEEGRKVSFTELSWKRASQNMEQLFPKRSIQGWFLCGSPGDDLSPLNYWKQHMQYFGGPNKLMYLSCGTEGDETVYVTSEDGFYKLQGYSIYYERNQMMQDYMVLRKDVKRIETDTNDKVIEEFRKRMGENKEEAADRHQTVGLLRGMCMAMSVVILAGGIVMFNNYEQMDSMESVVVSAIPAKAEKLLLGDKAQQKDGKKESGVILEEADGEVYPTSAVNKETMSETMPETSQAQTAAQAGESAGETAAVKETAAAAQKITEETVTQAAKTETSPATEAAAAEGQRTHTVVEGETLYGICIAEYKNVNKLKEICELNGLEDENKIVAGQKLRLP